VSARLGRYARELALDFLRERGIAIALILGVFTWAASNIEGQQWAALAEPSAAQSAARWAAKQLTSDFLLLLLVTFSGIISNDRKAGFVRFLFAKPMDPMAYYGTKTLVHGAMLVAVVAVWMVLLMVLLQPFSPLPAVQLAGVRLFVYGGLMVLASAAARLDFLWLAAVLLAGFLAKLVMSDYAWGADAVAWVAPWTALNELDQAIFAGRRATLREAAYPVVYGMACFAAAMVVVRKRPLAG
jgi:hypothetical protein